MANNSTLPAAGDVIGDDDVGGVKYQVVKNAYGADGAMTRVTSGAGLPVAPQFTELASLTAGALNADLVPSTDVSAYKSISVQVTAAATSGTLTFQGSNDNSTWVSVAVTPLATASPTLVTTTTTAGIWTCPVSFRYLRVRMTAYSSGTANGVCELSASAWVSPSPSVSGTVVVNGAANVASDAVNPGSLIQSSTFPYNSNGTTWDRQRGNINDPTLASGARTTTQTGADTTNYNGRGVKVVLDTTSVGTGSVTLKIQGKDANNVYYDMLTGTAVTTVSTVVYTLYPGATAAANLTVNDVLPRTWRVVVTANNANTQTYSVSSCVIL